MKFVNRQSAGTISEHGGTIESSLLIPFEQMREQTEGGHLHVISEFEIAPGGALEPHYHDTIEYYFGLSGTGRVQIDDEVVTLRPGDIVEIPRNAVHTAWPESEGEGEPEPMRALAVSIGFLAPEDPTHYVAELDPPAAEWVDGERLSL